jgi:hypothetical protein
MYKRDREKRRECVNIRKFGRESSATMSNNTIYPAGLNREWQLVVDPWIAVSSLDVG